MLLVSRRGASSGRQFGRQDIDRFDVRGRGEQLLGALQQRRGDRPVKMSLAARRVREEVGNAECRVIDLDREPGGRLGLSLGQRQGAGEKSGELIFLSRPGLQRNQQSQSDHALSPCYLAGPRYLRPAVRAPDRCLPGLSSDASRRGPQRAGPARATRACCGGKEWADPSGGPPTPASFGLPRGEL